MALIGILREKMTKWVVGFVAIAISAFILNDLFGNGPRSIFNNGNDDVGEIAGTSISREEYQSFIQERENNYILNFGRRPSERENPTIQQQAWELLVIEHAIKSEFKKTGVVVTADEVWDMIQGKNVDENIKRSFSDSLGNFDRKRVIQYINSLDTPPPGSNQQMLAQWQEGKYRWDLFKKELALGRTRIKYENLLIKTNYVTAAESEHDYHTQNDIAEIKYLYVPFYTVSDSLVNPTDDQLRKYFNTNKEKYKTQESRSLIYVSFPIQPSAEDSAKLKAEAIKIANDFKTVSDDSLFASTNTEGSTPYLKYTASTLPPSLNINQLKIGRVEGPFIENGSYKIIKVVKTETDTVSYAKASHILIRWENERAEAKKTAKDKASKILAELKAGASFATKAQEFGTDGTASKGGDLGWFSSGQMVKPFEKAVFDATRTGVLNNIVETQFGYHLIDVTALKNNTTCTVASIDLAISPSSETQNKAFLKAQNFSSGVSTIEEFRAKSKKENIPVIEAADLKSADRQIGNLGEARQVITWLFRDATEGKISDVFDLNDNYLVAMMTDETDEGYKSFDKVKNEIIPLVKNELKADRIIQKLSSTKGTLDEIAKQYGNEAALHTSSDLRLNTKPLTSIGLDATAIGVAFSLDKVKRSKPFSGGDGVLVIELQNKIMAPEIGDYGLFKNQLLQNLNNKSSMGITQAIKENANIKDARYKFY